MEYSVDLSKFSVGTFDKGAGKTKIVLWYFVNALFVRPSIFPFKGMKKCFLRFFGAKLGKNINIKPGVLIKSPWFLEIGDNCWIGENVWIDNLDKVKIGNNVCISQGALLLTGNHDYKVSNMPYRNGEIVIEDGAWVGGRAVVCSGVTVQKNALLTVGSVATRDLEANGIYQGNPAIKIRERIIEK